MSIHYQDDRLTLLHGDAIEHVRTLDSGSVQIVVTSPPYYGLRNYGEDGQYGAEATTAQYVDRLVTLFREIRRVLTIDGTVWLNLGDSFDPKTKNLLGVPWKVAFALQDDDWVLRSDIIWHKPNPMPEPVTDRPTKAHEYLFLLARNPRYYYDADAIKEPGTGRANHNRNGFARPEQISRGLGSTEASHGYDQVNRRDVWTVPPAPFSAAHFATYPPELVRPCIRAGSRLGDTVLDPFSGSGTTGLVALQEGRQYVGIDMNAKYLDMSLRERFQEQPLDIYGGAA